MLMTALKGFCGVASLTSRLSGSLAALNVLIYVYMNTHGHINIVNNR